MVKKAIKSLIEQIDLPINTIEVIQTTRYAQAHKFSTSCYGDFNLGLHVQDVESEVLANRHSLQHCLPKGSQIQWLDQIHSNKVIVANQLITPYPSADAIITRQANLALAIMTADCLPILLANKKGGEIAALHCGWRSMADHIVSHTLHKMKSKPQDIIAWLGPCISQQYFEVGEEVRLAFIKLHPQLTSFFSKKKVAKYQANLSGIAKFLLELSGVTTVIDSQQCTYANQDKYYSYRRNNITGRMASLICIKS